MRISDWSSDVCSSDLIGGIRPRIDHLRPGDRNLASLSGLPAFVLGQQLRTARADGWTLHVLPAVVHGVSSVGSATSTDVSPSSEERRGGNECVSTFRSRWSTYH